MGNVRARMGKFIRTTQLAILFFLFSAPLAAKPMRVLLVSPEQTGIYFTGGLGHVVDGLAEALNRDGVEADVVMPFYENVGDAVKRDARPTGQRLRVALGRGTHARVATFAVYAYRRGHTRTFLFKHEPAPGEENYFHNPPLPHRPKYYGPEAISGEAFGAFSRAASDFLTARRYDLAVLNDWPTGLTALFQYEARGPGQPGPKIVFALHNMGYQGLYPREILDFLHIDRRHFEMHRGLELHGQASFLKAGFNYADVVYTVSPRYASEIATPRFGHGLDGLMRRLQLEYRLTGVLSGIAEEEWSPSRARDPETLPFPFSAEDITGKARGKRVLHERFGLEARADVPLLVLTSRIVEQKGFAYLPAALETLLRREDIQCIVIGDGDERYVREMESLASRFPAKLRYTEFSSRDEKLATAYADLFVNAAWYEPCGLNQFFALLNGTIPVVTDVGGLGSSVKEGVNGFVAPEATGVAVAAALDRAIAMYRGDPARFAAIRRRGMTEKHGWSTRVAEYRALFRYVLSQGPAKLSIRYPAGSSEGLGALDLVDLLDRGETLSCPARLEGRQGL